MSRLRLYVDEDAMDGDLIRGLRSREIDVVTAAGASMIRRKDEEHLRVSKPVVNVELVRIFHSSCGVARRAEAVS